MRTKTNLRFRAEQLTQKKLNRPFKIGHADIFIDVETFDLVELRAVRRVDFVTSISGAWCDHANRRRRGFHRPDLNSGSMRPQ